MADALDEYLATKKPTGGDALDDYLGGGKPREAPVPTKPVKFVPPFPVRTVEAAWGDKPWHQKLVDLARGRSPMQTQEGVDEVLGQGGVGPGTQKYDAIKGLHEVKNAGAGMMAGGAAGAAFTGALLPLVATGAGRIAAGTLGSAVGGGVGSGTQKAMEGGSPGGRGARRRCRRTRGVAAVSGR